MWTTTTTFLTTDTTLSQPVQIQVDALTAQAQAVQAQIDSLDEELATEVRGVQQVPGGPRHRERAHVGVAATGRRRQADKARQQARLAERIKAVYKSGGRDQLLQLLLFADGMEDLYNRIRLVTILADQDQRLVSDLESSTTRLDLLLTAVDDQKRQELALREQLTARAAEIQTTLAVRERTLAGLDAR